MMRKRDLKTSLTKVARGLAARVNAARESARINVSSGLAARVNVVRPLAALACVLACVTYSKAQKPRAAAGDDSPCPRATLGRRAADAQPPTREQYAALVAEISKAYGQKLDAQTRSA